MSEENKPSELVDGIEIELGDLSGSISNKPAEVEFPAVKQPPPIPEEEIETPASKLGKIANRAWICIPSQGEEGFRINIREIDKCTSEEFFDWVNYIYPAAKLSSHKPEQYSDVRMRDRAILSVVQIYENIRMTMKRYGTSVFKLSKN